jgi:hypothetical protein
MSRFSLRPALLTALLAIALLALSAGHALAASSQESWFEDDVTLEADPAATLEKLRLLGVDRVRVAVRWQSIAPDAFSRRRPSDFNSADPAAYPAGTWTVWDKIVSDASQDGITLSFDLLGGAPLWATGPGAPHDTLHANWEPSPSEFGKFAHAVAMRYSGNYDPNTQTLSPGDPNDLPKVSFWSIWNEPNYGPSLAPQGVPGHLQVENTPRMYRNLVAAAWNALQATGHSGDSVLIGELAPRGALNWGVFSGMKPLIFLRAMYCVGTNYRPLRGHAAALRGCPTTAAGSRRFRAQNPGLFDNAGIADHPYMRWYPPNQEKFPDPNSTSLGEIGNLTRSIDRLQRAYGSKRRLPIYDTEFGYITTPPKRDTKREPWVTQSTGAFYLNWAEYISWRNPRIESYSQFLLNDPLPRRSNNDFGGFASGLLTFGRHTPKPTYAAWRLPLFLPATTGRRGRRLEVWGCARPAHFAQADTGDPQTVQIQFRRGTGNKGRFRTVRTVAVNGHNCYFDLRLRFPSSGTVRLAWAYPTSDQLLGFFDPLKPHTAFSRDVRITLR